jgi:hypothetical protein
MYSTTSSMGKLAKALVPMILGTTGLLMGSFQSTTKALA